MTEVEMARVEAELGIILPVAFRRLMTNQGYLLRGLTQVWKDRDLPFLTEELYIDPDQMIRRNLVEREPGDNTSRWFPAWWTSYVLVGKPDVLGDFCGVRLDDDPRVWQFPDRSDGPVETFGDLDAYVADVLDGYDPEPEHKPWSYIFWERADAEATAGRQRDFITAGEAPFLAHIIDDPADDLRRLVFADWLEENGEGPRAEFIRVRVALDGKRPEFGEYADAVERLRACEYRPPRIEVPPGFAYFAHDSHLERWWDDSGDTLEGGVPSFADVDIYSDFGETARRIVENLPELFATTPIRGLELNHQLNGHAAAIFAAPGAAGLTRLRYESQAPEGVACPVTVELSRTSIAKNLRRLELLYGIPNDATTKVLAAIEFVNIRRFDASGWSCGPEAGAGLMNAVWFRRLERFSGSVPPGAYGPITLPDLHTLCVWIPDDDAIEPFGRNAELPALRRFFIHGANLRGKRAEALAGLRCGELVELWVRNSALRPADLKTLLAAPWAKRLELLTIEHDEIDPEFNAVIDSCPCAKTLRVRTLK